jgi:hypothetical protein
MKTNPSWRRVLGLIHLGSCLVLFVAGCDMGDFGRTSNPVTQQKLSELDTQFSREYPRYTKRPVVQTADTYVRGKAIVLDRYAAERQLVGARGVRVVRKTFQNETEGYKFSSVYLDLPSDRRASTPDEVSTVVLLDYDLAKVGSSARVFRWTCQVTIIDLVTNAISGQMKNFTGDPPTTISRRDAGDEAGDKPDKQILNYLSRLRQVPSNESSTNASP